MCLIRVWGRRGSGVEMVLPLCRSHALCSILPLPPSPTGCVEVRGINLLPFAPQGKGAPKVPPPKDLIGGDHLGG